MTALTTALLDRTEELRQLDRQRADVNAELALAKSRERDSPRHSATSKRLKTKKSSWKRR